MTHCNLKGLGIALITPFKKDHSIDFEALKNIVNYQVINGANYFVVMGTTGEVATLTPEEKNKVLQTVISINAGRLPIVLGLGGNCTQFVLDDIDKQNFTGVDAILSVAPYYNKPSQRGMYAHYEAIAKKSPVPVIIYNVPSRTGVNISAETTLKLAHDFDNIIAVKEASGNFRQIDDIIKNKPNDFQVISGDDGITFPLITLGAVGVISVLGNAVPKEFSRMVSLALEGKYEAARKIHYKFSELIEVLFKEGSPAGVKALLSAQGIIENELRLPLVPTTLHTHEEIVKLLEELKISAMH